MRWNEIVEDPTPAAPAAPAPAAPQGLDPKVASVIKSLGYRPVKPNAGVPEMLARFVNRTTEHDDPQVISALDHALAPVGYTAKHIPNRSMWVSDTGPDLMLHSMKGSGRPGSNREGHALVGWKKRDRN